MDSLEQINTKYEFKWFNIKQVPLLSMYIDMDTFEVVSSGSNRQNLGPGEWTLKE